MLSIYHYAPHFLNFFIFILFYFILFYFILFYFIFLRCLHNQKTHLHTHLISLFFLTKKNTETMGIHVLYDLSTTVSS
jgi:hypothetical protein